jgi:predicted nucleic acid-binding protein
MISSLAVVDAGLAIFIVLDTPGSAAASRLLKYLLEKQISLYAPHLWHYEVISVIHKYLFDKIIEPEEAEAALATAFNLSVNLVDDEDESLCRAAFRWATLLKQRAAYDGFYVALAEKLGAELWTSDEKLANNTRQLGVNWVRWIGKFDSSIDNFSSSP